jgi:hypothetical protein
MACIPTVDIGTMQAPFASSAIAEFVTHFS